MTYHEQTQTGTQAHEDESVFILRVVWITNEPRIFIAKHGLCLVETDAVLSDIGFFFGFVPLEMKVIHALTVITM